MAEFVLTVKATAPTAMETAVNAELAPLLNHYIKESWAIAADEVRVRGGEIQFALRYDDAGTVISHPYKLKVFNEPNVEALETSINAYLTANSSYWFGPIYLGDYSQARRAKNYLALLLYNEDATDGAANYEGTGAVMILAGDVTGAIGANTVERIRNRTIATTAPSTGAVYTWNATSSQWEPVAPVQYFASGAAAAAAAAITPFINGTRIVVYPGTPTSEAGTYTVDTNGGIAFPGDYTKVNDLTDTASEVAIVDSGGYYTGSDVEAALQELGATAGGGIAFSGLTAGANVLDTLLVDNYGSARWLVSTTDDAGNRETFWVEAQHDGTSGIDATTADYTVTGPGPTGTVPVTLSVDVNGSGGSQTMRLIATITGGATWQGRVLRSAL